ncbi:hypothetical protein DRB06_07130 [Actinomyces sp. Z5]|uniref:Uncharacterized protein n=1 Tax=Actinomyces glycerinitolerans TaxID=1892869 RepID=A0A1M4S1G7_9ACTO|nr:MULTISPECIES: DUF6290 family protein [Actinomyces]RAX21045.1 hypothetical protein DRB06_07130 [Actinomyces sp. Z5]SHE26073.1 Hypothetical protein ACGLYG10_2316 [Actinomyces glycerinitolerans]
MAKTVDAEMIAKMREESEVTREAEYPVNTVPVRPNRSQVYSVRLTPQEREAIEAVAEAKHLPASTLVRAWILERLEAEHAA